MSDQLCFSVFVSNYEALKPYLYQRPISEQQYLFTSLHIGEEVDSDYATQVKSMCHQLAEYGYKLVADISKKTLAYFQADHVVDLAKEYRISMIRIDFGYSVDEMMALAKQMPVCINASTLSEKDRERLEEKMAQAPDSCGLMAIHNYYPRPETGLDEDFFGCINQWLKQRQIPVMAFIASPIHRRKPLCLGLPTLEKHRQMNPYCSFLELKVKYGVDQVFVGDGVVDRPDLDKIEAWAQTGVITMPIICHSNYRSILSREYDIRLDSPQRVKRLVQSRLYGNQGQTVKQYNTVDRKRGCITIDNQGYARYSGEIQIVTEDLPADDRVNVIGYLSEEFLPLLDIVRNGDRIVFQEVK